MANDDLGRVVFFNMTYSNRLNNRIFGNLRGKALKKAQRIVDRFGSISTSGEYGSIEIDSKDFVKVEMNDIDNGTNKTNRTNVIKSIHELRPCNCGCGKVHEIPITTFDKRKISSDTIAILEKGRQHTSYDRLSTKATYPTAEPLYMGSWLNSTPSISIC
ncbi:MAG: hypothetical protein WBZ36_06525 [Candidatus Nitrosopolaris sp.]